MTTASPTAACAEAWSDPTCGRPTTEHGPALAPAPAPPTWLACREGAASSLLAGSSWRPPRRPPCEVADAASAPRAPAALGCSTRATLARATVVAADFLRHAFVDPSAPPRPSPPRAATSGQRRRGPLPLSISMLAAVPVARRRSGPSSRRRARPAPAPPELGSIEPIAACSRRLAAAPCSCTPLLHVGRRVPSTSTPLSCPPVSSHRCRGVFAQLVGPRSAGPRARRGLPPPSTAGEAAVPSAAGCRWRRRDPCLGIKTRR